MANLIAVLVCLILTFLSVVLRKVYFSVPEYELKRRVAAGDVFASRIYPAVANGESFSVLLWIILSVVSVGALVFLSYIFPLVFSIILVAVWVWLAFSSLFDGSVLPMGRKIAFSLTPFFVYILNRGNKLIKQPAKLHKHYPDRHTRIYEPEDLRKFLQKQSTQQDNRISPQQIDSLSRLISLDKLLVREYFRPWKESIKLIADENVGPKLLDDLHRSKQTSFLVVKNKSSREVVGVLRKDILGLKSRGPVADYMNDQVDSISSDTPIEKALALFASSGQSLLVVTEPYGDRDEIVGTISVKEALDAMLGRSDPKMALKETTLIKDELIT